MSADTGAVDWAAALAEIEAEIATLQATADVIRQRIVRGGGPMPGGGGGGGIRPDTFLKMSIPDAAKKLLEMKREKQSTQQIIDALVQGGLPPSKYNTVYSILMRRERNMGDLINFKGDWALAEWYPNHRPKAKTSAKDSDATKETTDKKATA